MLAIEVAFLTGRYVATSYNSRDDSEWPPHPARLFSALAATHFTSADEDRNNFAAERSILEWLEQQPPPSIEADEAAAREVTTVFVPVNDVALTDVDEEAMELEAARGALAEAQSAGNMAAVKTSAAVVKRTEATLAKAIARAIEVPARSVDPRYGTWVLPEHRIRQPRTFPSMTPADPRVTYVWPDAFPTDAQRVLLDRLLRRVVRLGHSSSLVSLRLVENPGIPTWRPSGDGEHTLRGVAAGQLAALEAAFERHQEAEPRVMPFVPLTYTRAQTGPLAEITRFVFSDEWLGW